MNNKDRKRLLEIETGKARNQAKKDLALAIGSSLLFSFFMLSACAFFFILIYLINQV